MGFDIIFTCFASLKVAKHGGEVKFARVAGAELSAFFACVFPLFF